MRGRARAILPRRRVRAQTGGLEPFLVRGAGREIDGVPCGSHLAVHKWKFVDGSAGRGKAALEPPRERRGIR